jgi:hypothetical protein
MDLLNHLVELIVPVLVNILQNFEQFPLVKLIKSLVGSHEAIWVSKIASRGLANSPQGWRGQFALG